MKWRRLCFVCFLAEIHDAIGTLGEAFTYDLLRRSVQEGGDCQLGDLFWSFVDSNLFFSRCDGGWWLVCVYGGARGGPGRGPRYVLLTFYIIHYSDFLHMFLALIIST
jgi:hypothetical protein